MFLKIATSAAVAALVAPCLYMCVREGRNAAAAQHILMLRRGGSFDPPSVDDSTDFVRSWLKPYIATRLNPDHKRAEVETLIRFGTTHVKRGVQLEDVKDALAIEFLAQVDGKPVPIEGFDEALFIGTIGAAYNYNALKEAGITHIVSVARSARANFPEQIDYFDELNLCPKTTPEAMQDIFRKTSEYIEEATSRKDFKVMVNDWEGAGRSAVLIIAHIMISQRVRYATAKEIVMRTRPGIIIEGAYELQLLQLEQDLHLDAKKKRSSHYQGADYYDYGDDLDDTDAFESEMDDDEIDGTDEFGPDQEYDDDDDGSHFFGYEEEYDEFDDDDVNNFVYFEDDDEDFIGSSDEDISVSPKE